MSTILIKPQGQTLTLTAATSIPGNATAKLYSDAALTAQVTLPLTVASDTTLYVPDGTLNLTLTTPDGISLLTEPIECYRPRVFAPTPSLAQLAALVGSATIGRATDVQTFTTAGTFTWTKPAGAKLVKAQVWGAGAGGGSGARGAAGTIRGAGGGGGGGGYGERTHVASDVPSTVAVTVGAGGAGGAAPTTNDTVGNAGGAGGTSTFSNGSIVAVGQPFVRSTGGGSGGAGTAAASGSGGGASSGSGTYATQNPGSSGAGGSHTAAGSTVSATATSSGGGGGGGVDAANVERNGGGCNTAFSFNISGGVAPGGNGNVVPNGPLGEFGFGGTGGAGNATAGGGAGTNGSRPGGGGGGAGGGTNGTTGGAGGNGADGVVIVTTYF